MRIVITGAAGQLGRELARQLGERAIPLTREQLDITDAGETARRLQSLRPDVVVNAAGFTDVDGAETESAACRAVNADAVARLAEICASRACKLVQVSTDYVFGDDGIERPRIETDTPAPLGVYGRTKWAGEQAVRQFPRNLVVRTAGLYSHEISEHSRTFLAAVVRRADRGDRLRVVDDQWVTPSYVPHVARVIESLIRADAEGTWHAANPGPITWFHFAQAILRVRRPDAALEPIPSTEWGSAARRPRYSALAIEKLERLGMDGLLPEVPSALDEALSAM